MLLTAASRPSRRLSVLQQCIQRYSVQPSKSQAFLRPLAEQKDDPDEFEGVMALVMDRPEAKNALSVQMVSEIRESLAALPPTARVLLLHTPHRGVFCAGADLRERAKMSEGQVSAFLDSLRSMVHELEGVKVPSIAVIDGFALGGGLELALGCDLRVAGPNAQMALPETKLGIIPGAGGTQRLSRLVGRAKAKELIFTGRRIAGPEAERIGLVNKVSEADGGAWEEALIMSRQIVTGAPLALAATKAAIEAEMSLEDGLTLERRLYNPLLKTQDRNEGLKAFAEKRRARFTEVDGLAIKEYPALPSHDLEPGLAFKDADMAGL